MVSNSLASSPPKQSEVPKPAAGDANTDESAAAKSPTADDYPRPTDGEHANAHTHKEGGEKEDHTEKNKKEKKEKLAFEHVKDKNFNKNPPSQNNFNIKQPAGKTL